MEDLYAHVVVDDLIQSAIKEETRQLVTNPTTDRDY